MTTMLNRPTSAPRSVRGCSCTECNAASLLDDLPDQIFKLTVEGTVLEAVHGCIDASTALPIEGRRINLRELMPAPFVEPILEGLRIVGTTAKGIARHIAWIDDEGAHECEARLVPASDGAVLVIVRELHVDDLLGEPSILAELDPAARALSSRTVGTNGYHLTSRELTVLEFVTNGAADKEIATQLGVSVFTVNKHVSNILRKMGASSRTEASTRTLREGLVT